MSEIVSNDILYQEKSRVSKKGIIVVGAVVGLLLIAFGYTTYKSIQYQHILFMDYFLEVMCLWVISKQAFSRYTYTLTKEELIILEQTIFRRKEMVIPYRYMDGIYLSRKKFLGRLRYRYKYRKISSLDGREIWALAFTIPVGKKLKHARLWLKADDAFFETLEQFMPGRVRVEPETVVFYALLREEAFEQGLDPDTYVKEVQQKNADTVAVVNEEEITNEKN